MSKNIDALEKLVLNTNELAELNKRQSEVNILEILQVETTEIRHSNILAWLLDPEESHGLGDSFLRGIIKAAIRNLRDRDGDPYETIDSNKYDGISNNIIEDLDWWISSYFYKVKVEREHDYKDIIITGKGRISGEGDEGKDGFLIAIENKVKAKEGTKRNKPQTEAYYEDLMDPNAKRVDGTKYSNFKKRMFVFLTPDGEQAKDPHWTVITYEDIVMALESSVNVNEIPPASALVIRDYIKSIKRHITGNPELIEICDKLFGNEHGEALNIILDARKGKYEPTDYKEKRLLSAIMNRYGKALDAIENNRSDASYMVGQYIRKALRKISRDEAFGIVLPEKFNQKAYIKFTTEQMTKLLDGKLDEPVSPWRTKDKYYYQFVNRAQGSDKAKVSFFLTFGGGEYVHDNNLLSKELLISDLLNAENKPYNIYKSCAIPKKKNSKVFDLKKTDNLEEEVELFVRKMVDETMKAEEMIQRELEII